MTPLRALSVALHDMHGNLSEWTRSAYLPYPFRVVCEPDNTARSSSRQTSRAATGACRVSLV